MNGSITMLLVIASCTLFAGGLSTRAREVQNPPTFGNIDGQVRQFLDKHRWFWGQENVPERDGQALHDIIVRHAYKNALEIGTSTGHSGIWIAWALSKTNGRLVTIEIDKYRYERALANFREAGVAKYIDARLGDAHELVPALPGPFDFVFCDADKEWYKSYLAAVLPKITVGGCFAAHNVAEGGYSGGRGRWGRWGSGGGWGGGWVADFLQYVRSFPNLETTLFAEPGSHGISISYKKAEK